MKGKGVIKNAFLRWSESISKPHFTRFMNLNLFYWINEHGEGKRILNLEAGDGFLDHHLHTNIKTIKLDLHPSKQGLDVIADAHFLPFKNESFDIVQHCGNGAFAQAMDGIR